MKVRWSPPNCWSKRSASRLERGRTSLFSDSYHMQGPAAIQIRLCDSEDSATCQQQEKERVSIVIRSRRRQGAVLIPSWQMWCGASSHDSRCHLKHRLAHVWHVFCKDSYGPEVSRFVSSDVQAILRHRSRARKDSVRTARLAEPNDLAEPTSVDFPKARNVVSGEISSKDG